MKNGNIRKLKRLLQFLGKNAKPLANESGIDFAKPMAA